MRSKALLMAEERGVQQQRRATSKAVWIQRIVATFQLDACCDVVDVEAMRSMLSVERMTF